MNVEYMYAFLGGRDADHAYMIFRVADNAAAASALASPEQPLEDIPTQIRLNDQKHTHAVEDFKNAIQFLKLHRRYRNVFLKCPC